MLVNVNGIEHSLDAPPMSRLLDVLREELRLTGVKEGWLDSKYAAAARKGWLGLVKYINADGDVTNVCAGTNKKNDLEYYLDRPRNTGDLHGQAPILWTATALLR